MRVLIIQILILTLIAIVSPLPAEDVDVTYGAEERRSTAVIAAKDSRPYGCYQGMCWASCTSYKTDKMYWLIGEIST